MTTATNSQKTEPKPATEQASTTTSPVEIPAKTSAKRPTGVKVLAGAVAAVILLGGGIWLGTAIADPTTSDAYTKLEKDTAALQVKFDKSRAAFMTMDSKFAAVEKELEAQNAKLRVAEGKLEAK